MPSVQEVDDIHQLAGYRLAWNSLLGQTPKATFFQSPDWLEVYWHHFGCRQRLRVLIVSSGGRVIGILPLVVRTEPTRVGPVRVLTYPLDDWGTFYGPIGPNPTATLLASLRHIRRSRRDWDLLDLRPVDLAGCDRGRTALAMQLAGLRPQRQAWMQAAVVDIQGSWETYWNSRPKRWRYNVRRLQRRLAEQGRLTHVRYRPEGESRGDGDPRWDLYDACLQVARTSWQGTSTTGTTLCHGSVCRYLRNTHARAARIGSLDLNLLMVDEVPAAFAYNYVYQGSVFALRIGYDPRFAAFGPGNVLQRMVVEDSFQRGDRLYDMGPPPVPCKRNWQTDTVTSYRYTYYPAMAPRAQLLRLKHWAQNRFYDADAVLRSRSA